MTATLVVNGLSGGYGPARVLHEVSFDVGAGEIVGILGANGAGKSTIMRAVAGSLPVCRGSIVLAGRELNRQSAWNRVRAGIALVPEGRRIFGAMSVEDNLEVARLVRRRTKQVDDVYDLFPKLRERRKQLAGSLSGGEQQMLAIARALMTEPKALFIDEMSAGLAPVIVDALLDTLVTMRGADMSIVLVEQSPHLIADIVDRVVVLDRGRVVGVGTIDELGGSDRLSEIYLGVASVDDRRQTPARTGEQ